MSKSGTYIIACSYGGKAIHSYFRELADILHQRGNKVILLYDRRRTEVEDHEADIPVYVWPSSRPTKWRDARFLKELVHKYRPDCIMASFGAVNMCLLMGWLLRVPVRLAWMLTLFTQNKRDASLMSASRVWLDRNRKGVLLKFATNLVTLTDAVVNDAIKWFRAKREAFLLLPYALPVPVVDEAARKDNAIVCIGRMHQSKGQEFLVRAMPEIVRQVPEAHLELIGDGPRRSSLEALVDQLGVRNSVTFAGGKPYPYVLDAMASSAVVVSPSLHEAGGLINVEAQSVGTPVVASRVDGIQEIILDGETGYLVPAGEPGGIAEKVVHLLCNPELREEMGKKGRAHFDKGYGRANINIHADAFEDIVNNAGTQRR